MRFSHLLIYYQWEIYGLSGTRKIYIEKEPGVSKRKQKYLLLCCILAFLSTYIHVVINKLKAFFNFYCLRVQLSYHRFNNLVELLNGDLTEKIGWVIFSEDVVHIKFNWSVPYKDNRKSVYKGNANLNV